jgi:hypothetical protein
MVFKLALSAEKRWKMLRGSEKIREILNGVQFKDGQAVKIGLETAKV